MITYQFSTGKWVDIGSFKTNPRQLTTKQLRLRHKVLYIKYLKASPMDKPSVMLYLKNTLDVIERHMDYEGYYERRRGQIYG